MAAAAAEMVKVLLEQSLQAPQGTELPPHTKGQLLAPKHLHLRSRLPSFMSAPALELVPLKGSPVLATEQGSTPFFCKFCDFSREVDSILGLAYPQHGI